MYQVHVKSLLWYGIILSQNESGLSQSYVFTQQKSHGKIKEPYIKYDRNMGGG